MKTKRLFLLSICICTALLGCTKNETNQKEPNNEVPKEEEAQSKIDWVKEPFATYESDPIALYDQGFIVNDGNKEGFMDIEGNLILDMNYQFQECFMKDAYGVMEGVDELTYLSQLLDVEGYDQGCWTGIVGPFVQFYYDSDQKTIKEIRYDMEASTNIEATTDLEAALKEINADTFLLPVNLSIETKENGEDNSTNEGYMLVSKGELQSDVIYEDYHMRSGYHAFHILDGLNAVKKDNKWAIVNQEGTFLSEFVYDSADILNDEYVKVKKGTAIGLFTKDRAEYLYEGITSITAPSQHVVFAKQNDLWGLMKLEQQ